MKEPVHYDIFDPTIPVLEFRLASFPADDDNRVGYERINFTLRNGELMLIRLPSTDARCRLADAAQGLIAPVQGDVLYRGKDWTGLGPRAAERRRGEIGRVFAANAWLSNLDVEENVSLRLRHRRFLSRRKVAAQVQEAASAFGVDSLSQGRPSDLPAHDQQVAQWIRAFAGDPPLALLEHPVNADGLPFDRLSGVVRSMRARGGAIIWLTARDDVWNDPSLEPRQRFVVDGETLAACKEDA